MLNIQIRQTNDVATSHYEAGTAIEQAHSMVLELDMAEKVMISSFDEMFLDSHDHDLMLSGILTAYNFN